MPARKITIIAVAFLSLLLPNHGAAQDQSQQIEYPKLSDLLSSDDLVRGLAITQLKRSQEKLIARLSLIIDVNSYMKFSREMRYNACYLLKVLRPTSEDAIKALISVVERDADFDYFYPERGHTDVAAHFAFPSNALYAIGHPASRYILDAITETDNKRRWFALCACLEFSDDSNEGFRIACYLVRERIAKETDPAKRASLESALNNYKEGVQKVRGITIEEERIRTPEKGESLLPQQPQERGTKPEAQLAKTREETATWLVPVLVVAVVALAGAVVFLLLRRRHA